MRRSIVCALGICLSVFVLSALPAADAPAPAPAPTTTANAEIELSELKLHLRPLTAAELKVEADGWLALVQEKAKALTEAELAAKKAEGEEKTKLLEDVQKVRDAQTKVVDRLNTVLKAMTNKGGDPKEYEAYVSAISGLSVEVEDAGAAMKTIKNWALSPEGGIRWAKNIGLFIVTLIVFKILAGILGGITGRAVGFKGTSHLLRDFLVNVVRKVTIFVGFVLALSMLEVNIGPFLAAMGAAGFVIAFALQGTLSNFAAGVMILLYRPYDLRDKVTAGGQTGVVTSMNLVSTVITSDEGKVVTIPNSSIWGGVITNHSRAPQPPAEEPAGA